MVPGLTIQYTGIYIHIWYEAYTEAEFQVAPQVPLTRCAALGPVLPAEPTGTGDTAAHIEEPAHSPATPISWMQRLRVFISTPALPGWANNHTLPAVWQNPLPSTDVSGRRALYVQSRTQTHHFGGTPTASSSPAAPAPCAHPRELHSVAASCCPALYTQKTQNTETTTVPGNIIHLQLTLAKHKQTYHDNVFTVHSGRATQPRNTLPHCNLLIYLQVRNNADLPKDIEKQMPSWCDSLEKNHSYTSGSFPDEYLQLKLEQGSTLLKITVTPYFSEHQDLLFLKVNIDSGFPSVNILAFKTVNLGVRLNLSQYLLIILEQPNWSL